MLKIDELRDLRASLPPKRDDPWQMVSGLINDATEAPQMKNTSLPKAKMLQYLGTRLKTAKVLPIERISASRWVRGCRKEVSKAKKFLEANGALIVRSSSDNEDRRYSSCAGQFLSVKDVRTWDELKQAIGDVIGSYEGHTSRDEVLLQPLASGVEESGVIMTHDPETGTPYIVIEYSTAGDTDLVTSGKGRSRSLTLASLADTGVPDLLKPLLPTIAELEALFDFRGLDIEFAITAETVLIFQCRPIVWRAAPRDFFDREQLFGRVSVIADRLRSDLKSSVPPCEGETLFGTMPDWNPAEMIGLKPRPLAVSLYRYLITDDIWARARAAYGYRDVGRFPLMRMFGGTPYIDVRASLVSFTPAAVSCSAAGEVVDTAIERLRRNPHLFDKIEFEVIPTCFTPSLERQEGRMRWGVPSQSTWDAYLDALRSLTWDVLRPGGLFDVDGECLRVLSSEESPRGFGGPDLIARACELVEHVRLVGTPCFARVARAAFIATAIVKSLEKECGADGFTDAVLTSVETVVSNIADDFSRLSRTEFLTRHGHVRPGTYDIRVPRYDEDPERYFDWSARSAPQGGAASGSHVDRACAEHVLNGTKLPVDLPMLLDFARRAVAAREAAKYHFTRLLSDALGMLTSYGDAYGLTRDEMSFLELSDLFSSRANVDLTRWRKLIAERRAKWLEEEAIRLPPLITRPDDAFGFDQGNASPNFITRAVAEGRVATTDGKDFERAIVLVESADPGFDWIFTRGISGFVTAYGGENSHMAIRAREFGLPAVIGAGEAYYRTWKKAARLRLDCGARRVEILS